MSGKLQFMKMLYIGYFFETKPNTDNDVLLVIDVPRQVLGEAEWDIFRPVFGRQVVSSVPH